MTFSVKNYCCINQIISTFIQLFADNLTVQVAIPVHGATRP